jgi:site-specific DNA-methyltransferase (adenine-specific)
MTLLHKEIERNIVERGDCCAVLPKIASESIQIVYLDPPFYTQKTHTLKTRDNTAEYSFDDRWHTLDEYRNFIRIVLEESRRCLRETGSIFVHCDTSASHHIRLLLDEVFGERCFQSEIVWAYKRWSNNKKGLLNTHQTILFYSKSANFTFNTLLTEYSPTTNIDQILQSRSRNENGKSAYSCDEEGNVVLAEAKKGIPLSDVWNIPFLNPKARERVGYPTQKPILLMERILRIASNEGDTILDPFCGSGSMLVAAQMLKRYAIGIDISAEAVELSQKRLENPIKSGSAVVDGNRDAFLIKSDYERTILQGLDAIPVERNSGIDGFLRSYVEDAPVAVKIQKKHESLEDAAHKLTNAAAAKHCKYMILVRTLVDEKNTLFSHGFHSLSNDYLLVIDSFDFILNRWFQDRTAIHS